MNVEVFTQVSRTYRPTTGVGRFICNMVLGLARASDVNVSLLASRAYLGADGQLDPRSPLRGLPVHTFPLHERVMERTWKALGWPKADRWIGKPDWLWLPAEAYVPCRDQKIVMTSHDMNQAEPVLPGYGDPKLRPRYVKRFRYWFGSSLQLAQHVVTVSEHSKKRLCELFPVDPAKVTVVGCGVEQPYFDVGRADPASVPRTTEKPYLLVIGGLNMRKGGRHVLDVAAALARRKSELQILIAGPNDEDLALDAAALPNVRLLGFTPDADLPAILRHATALLFLSLYEGFGIPAAEAMAAGTPAIVANLTSLPGVVGDAGIVVPVTAAEEIAAVADKLLSDAPFRADYVARGHERANRLYTWNACVEKLVSVLRTN